MWKNYLTVAWRSLWKNKTYSTINVVGLAVGMTACLLILAVIRDQDRRDEHHARAERIYRVNATSEQIGRYATSPGPLGPAIERSVPQVEEAVRVQQDRLHILRENDRFAVEGLYAEASFLTVFDFPLAAGHPGRALADPYSIVLSRETARTLFGSEEAVGRAVTVEEEAPANSGNRETTLTVTGVLEKTDTGSHLTADAYVSFSTLTAAQTAEKPNSWTSDAAGSIFHYFTYVLLSETATPSAVEEQINRIVAPHTTRDTYIYGLALQPLTGIHLGPGPINEMTRSGIIEIGWVYIMSGLALLILLAAGFNYANLSLARSLTRAREIGVRKSLGAGRGQIAVQFLGESVLMALIALVLAVGMLYGLVPAFNSLEFARVLQTQIGLEHIMHPAVLLLFVGFAIAVGAVAGAYPALYLSRFDPVGVLKRTRGSIGETDSGFSARTGLTVVQLGLALCFIITAALLYRQARYLVRTDYGFATERLIHVDLQEVPPRAFKQKAMQLADIESVSLTSSLPVLSGIMRGDTLRTAAGTPAGAGDGVRAQSFWVGADYPKNMGMRFLAQAPDVRAAFTEGSSAIINEKASAALGLTSPEHIVGEVITFKDDPLRVAAVVENFAYTDPSRELDPLVLRHDPERFRHALVRVRPGATEDVISDVRDLWTQFGSARPLDYGIYEEALERMSAPMVEGAKVIGGAALLTVLIACLGLLGIASFHVQTRMKEIGIRKTLGATARDLTWLLSKRYLWLVAGASVFALPLAYGVNRQWLANYARRIDVGWTTPALSVTALLMIVLTVIGTQTVRAALTNPTDTLRFGAE